MIRQRNSKRWLPSESRQELSCNLTLSHTNHENQAASRFNQLCRRRQRVFEPLYRSQRDDLAKRSRVAFRSPAEYFDTAHAKGSHDLAKKRSFFLVRFDQN